MFAIPPNDPNWLSPPAEVGVPQDAELVHLFMPHMHFRGKDMTYASQFPDGTKKTIPERPALRLQLATPATLDTLLSLPKGTKPPRRRPFRQLRNNKFNPNPNKTVYYGTMTWEEMMSPFMAILVDVKTDPTKVFKRRTGQAVEGGD